MTEKGILEEAAIEITDKTGYTTYPEDIEEYCQLPPLNASHLKRGLEKAPSERS